MSNWKAMDDAPKDGRPIWARGYNGGSVLNGMHYAVVFWYTGPEIEEGGAWVSPAPVMQVMGDLHEYLPDAFGEVAPRILLS